MMDTPNSTNGNSNKTPTRENISSLVSKRGSAITPRKRANYKNPVKKQLFRKMKSNPQAWKKKESITGYMRGELDDNDEEQFVRHQRNKESSRDQKSKDKQRAKTDKSFVVSTFDLEAVLPTPCSMVGDLYYKRCLSTYNLSFYSLGDGKGTCYLWDEVNGGRGSNEIGSCILMHINSVAE
ncbi:unnamed protein product [Mytilus coruscus]|uniref:Uncharacterized protein n=1 Tax=Mytilus coruscus TaxID=42192 RepID=A0A6J8C546_MYTCO|nr:unnamed protein product [Mytilus coruscus]